ncbi:hypothetical protein GCM10010840_22580 [Deinococcus aerolatus]|uniref:Lipoprotein n=1 Tax=Deinococcus aerolatus TaxID=522487 RepID=A0ABQ2GBS0_9DEIO|nr:lipoprotein [Deinococcus aerolatus]GGL84305.1 hypothetical protein GCM10010840_22580 [Deinococcus aerolatus]
MKKIVLLTITAALALSACAPSYNPNAQKPDSELSCTEVKSELTRAQSARVEAGKNRGLSGQNVAWAIFFLPGVLANEYTNDQVQKAADERIAKLNQLYVAKGCS